MRQPPTFHHKHGAQPSDRPHFPKRERPQPGLGALDDPRTDATAPCRGGSWVAAAGECRVFEDREKKNGGKKTRPALLVSARAPPQRPTSGSPTKQGPPQRSEMHKNAHTQHAPRKEGRSKRWADAEELREVKHTLYRGWELYISKNSKCGGGLSHGDGSLPDTTKTQRGGDPAGHPRARATRTQRGAIIT